MNSSELFPSDLDPPLKLHLTDQSNYSGIETKESLFYANVTQLF